MFVSAILMIIMIIIIIVVIIIVSIIIMISADPICPHLFIFERRSQQ